MAISWTRKTSAMALTSCVPGMLRDDKRMKIPKGYIPMILVHGDNQDTETRVLVHVRELKEPCVAALLDMAEQQFMYSQQGVLRIPCDAQRFEHMVHMARKTKVRSG